jgi:hypothetical protein
MSTGSRDRAGAAHRDPRPRVEAASGRPEAASAFLLAVSAAIAAIALALGIGAIAFVLIPPLPGVAAAVVAPYQVAADATLLLVTPLLGLFLARRVPRNPIGYLFIVMTLGLGAGFFADGLVRHVRPDPVVDGFAVFISAAGVIGFLSMFLLLQVFPTGHLPSRRWRWLLVAVAAGGIANFVASLFEPAPYGTGIPGFVDPFAIPSLAPLSDAAGTASSVILVLLLSATVALLVARFRRGTPVERQQIKWFAWAASVITLLLIAAIVSTPVAAVSDTLWSIALGSFLLLPLAATIAILRHRLYDIDRIVSRTIGYAVVTAILAIAFYASVAAIPAVVEPWVQASSFGPLGVAASTLFAAALFQPVRGRVQRRVDAVFDRGRVNAEEKARQHARRLRDVSDLETIARETLGTVDECVSPTFAAVWVRTADTGRPAHLDSLGG